MDVDGGQIGKKVTEKKIQQRFVPETVEGRTSRWQNKSDLKLEMGWTEKLHQMAATNTVHETRNKTLISANENKRPKNWYTKER